jgi:hypothetical protein
MALQVIDQRIGLFVRGETVAVGDHDHAEIGLFEKSPTVVGHPQHVGIDYNPLQVHQSAINKHARGWPQLPGQVASPVQCVEYSPVQVLLLNHIAELHQVTLL